MYSKIYFSFVIGILTQIFFGVPFISARRVWIPNKQRIEANTASSTLGRYITMSDVLLYGDIDTNDTIPCYEKVTYENIVETFTEKLRKAVSKYGAYLSCRYLNTYNDAERHLNCIKDAIKSYPQKLESWIKGETLEKLGKEFPFTDNTISLCDYELSVYMKMILQNADLAAKKFCKLVEDSRKEAETNGRTLMGKITKCINKRIYKT